jgi:hypothetical protein
VIDSVNPEGRKTPQRRAAVAAHPIRAKILADLADSPIPLASEDLIIATGEASSTVKYHLGVLADVDWVESGPPESPGVSMPAAVSPEFLRA